MIPAIITGIVVGVVAWFAWWNRAKTRDNPYVIRNPSGAVHGRAMRVGLATGFLSGGVAFGIAYGVNSAVTNDADDAMQGPPSVATVPDASSSSAVDERPEPPPPPPPSVPTIDDGIAAVEQGELAEAESIFSQLLQQADRSPEVEVEAHVGLARVRILQGREEEARLELDEAERIAGNAILGTEYIALIEDARGDLPTEVYIVVAGDTLAIIAGRFEIHPDDILAVNDIDDPNLIFPGQELVIP
jgi:nucleoid-associated protein YgaU